MAITASRVSTEITITGASQEETTQAIMGRIDQLILVSSTGGQSFDLVFENMYGEEIYRKDDIIVDTNVHDLQPNILPLGPVTIKIENPVNQSGTVTVTIIEKERES